MATIEQQVAQIVSRLVSHARLLKGLAIDNENFELVARLRDEEKSLLDLQGELKASSTTATDTTPKEV